VFPVAFPFCDPLFCDSPARDPLFSGGLVRAWLVDDPLLWPEFGCVE